MKSGVNINGTWEIHDYSDVEYAGYNNNQKSVTGYIVLINITFIFWHLRSQKMVTLSVKESEYSAIM